MWVDQLIHWLKTCATYTISMVVLRHFSAQPKNLGTVQTTNLRGYSSFGQPTFNMFRTSILHFKGHPPMRNIGSLRLMLSTHYLKVGSSSSIHLSLIGLIQGILMALIIMPLH